ARLDPVAAAAILPGNGRRVVRALEVVALTGGPYAASLPPRHYLLHDVVQLGLDLDRSTLDARITARVDAMWEAGFVEEVRRLADRGLRDGLTASRALGYRQILQLLDGAVDEAQARHLTVVGTRKFARRQDSWFRKDERVAWLPATAADVAELAFAVSAASEVA
ncbi:MAG TPA: tRNA dimethylallyltransferase, partial [Propionibacteriaceae bacterium]